MRFRVWFAIWMMFNAYVLIDSRLPRLPSPVFEKKNPQPDLKCVFCGELLGAYRGATYWTRDEYPCHPACHREYWENRGQRPTTQLSPASQ